VTHASVIQRLTNIATVPGEFMILRPTGAGLHAVAMLRD